MGARVDGRMGREVFLSQNPSALSTGALAQRAHMLSRGAHSQDYGIKSSERDGLG
jgi:hypothetical protein